MAAKGYNFFEGTQEDINRRLLRKILALEEKVDALKIAVGDADSGLVKGVTDINTEIGDDYTANTIKGRIRALEDAG